MADQYRGEHLPLNSERRKDLEWKENKTILKEGRGTGRVIIFE